MSSTRHKVRAGFIGCGVFITRYHLPNVKKNPLYEIKALCDLDKDILEDRKKRFGCSYISTDYRDLFSDRDIDVIFIGTQHNTHARFIVEVAQAGKSIFVEKPMCLTREECKNVIDAVQKNKVKLMVGFNRRFAPSMIDAKEAFKKIKDNKPGMYLYRMVDDFLTWDNQEWHSDLKKAGGKLIGEGCHIFDFLCWFSDSEPVRIYAEGRLVDDDMVTIRFANGDIAAIVAGGIGSQYYPKELFEVFCNSSTIAVPCFCELTVSTPKEYYTKTYPLRKNPYEVKSGCEEGYITYMKSLQVYKSEHVTGKATPTEQPNPDKGHYNELTAYAHAILNNTPSPIDEFAGARATVMAIKAMEAIKSTKPQEIETSEYYCNYKK